MTTSNRSGGANVRAKSVKARDLVGRDNINIIGDEAIDAILAARGSRADAAASNQPTRESSVPPISLDNLRSLERMLENFVKGYMESHSRLVSCEGIQIKTRLEQKSGSAAFKQYNEAFWTESQNMLKQVHPWPESLAQTENVSGLMTAFNESLDHAKEVVEKVLEIPPDMSLEEIAKDFAGAINILVKSSSSIMEKCKEGTDQLLIDVKAEIDQIFAIINPRRVGSNTNDEINKQKITARPNELETSASSRSTNAPLAKPAAAGY
jgi:hypothetical protein